ncbi:hypothetical protein KIN20_026201 [Parelaphostrongylus tenuis]|uniref:Protein kinase domain-containing protein n=1 Tax=Parelaphostrongylus tenuis TaxID=148309 RepID=A0AAD5QX15_PARTN|nr:hypothetical protein KIN20_026201 [Parelaphostrongylus tenuis]
MSTNSRLRLDDFTNLQEIGRGGFGVVYAATQPNGERVALKKICSRAAGRTHKERDPSNKMLTAPKYCPVLRGFRGRQ